MGNKTKQTKYKWQVQGKVVAVKASLPLQDPFQDPARLVFSSPSAESPASLRLVASLSALVPVPPCTSLPSLSTSPPRSSSSPVTPPRTTRRPESSQDTSNSLSETTKSSTDSSRIPPSPPVVYSHTSTASSSRPPTKREESENCLKNVT